MKNIKLGALIVVTVLSLALAAVGIYYVKRKINYSFSYKDMVEGTIRANVRSECLK